MLQSRPAEQNGSRTLAEGDSMTLSKLRHDIRNYLNTIKLSTALLHRQRVEKQGQESIREIEKAVDGINELVSRFMGDADAPGLFGQSGESRK
jgi:nitrogen-specific signal transduction histidine kinase